MLRYVSEDCCMCSLQAEPGVPLLVPGLNRALYNWDGIKLEVLYIHMWTFVYVYSPGLYA